MSFIEKIKEKAKMDIKTIVLPESEDTRVLEATQKILKQGFAKIILIGNKEDVIKRAEQNNIDITGADIIEPETSNKFDEYANKIRKIQQEQKKIYKNNIKLEEERNQLFDSLDEDALLVEKRLKKIEEDINKNNIRLEELGKEFIEALTIFNNKQKERNKYSREKREKEKNYIQALDKSNKDISEIDISLIRELKEFINSDTEDEKEEITEIMTNNGKDERVPFNKNVIEKAINTRKQIAKKEAGCYIIAYEKMKKLLTEINDDDIKLDKYKKIQRDTSVKLAFLKAQKIYIVSFLDNERMTAINGVKVHKQLMKDACENFELDMEQFNNLYELILREISGKATKKAYKELYNKEYLKNIEEKEKSFEKEINSIKIKSGTIINSNYWRIEEIKNIYEVFQNEVSKKFEKDLSEFKLEQVEELDEENENNGNNENTKYEDKHYDEDDIFKTQINNDDVEYIEEYEYDDEYDNDEEEEYYDEDEDEEYDSDEYEADDEDDVEYDDEYYEVDEAEYDDEYYEVDEADDEDEDYTDEEKIKDKKNNRNNKKLEEKDTKNKKGLFNKFFKD